MCKPFGDETKPRPWSKYAKVNMPTKKPKEEGKLTEESEVLRTELPDDPRFKEFLQAQGKEALLEKSEEKKSTTKPANKSDTITLFADREEKFKEAVRELLNNVSDDCLVLIDGLPAKVKLNSLKQFLAPVKPKLLKAIKFEGEEETESTTTSALVSFNRGADKNKTLKRNGEFFGGFRLSITELTRVEIFGAKKTGKAATEDDGLTEEQRTLARQQHEKEVIEVISDTGRLFIRNLSYLCTEEDIEGLFKVRNHQSNFVGVSLILVFFRDTDKSPKLTCRWTSLLEKRRALHLSRLCFLNMPLKCVKF